MRPLKNYVFAYLLPTALLLRRKAGPTLPFLRKFELRSENECNFDIQDELKWMDANQAFCITKKISSDKPPLCGKIDDESSSIRTRTSTCFSDCEQEDNLGSRRWQLPPNSPNCFRSRNPHQGMDLNVSQETLPEFESNVCLKLGCFREPPELTSGRIICLLSSKN